MGFLKPPPIPEPIPPPIPDPIPPPIAVEFLFFYTIIDFEATPLPGAFNSNDFTLIY